MYDLSYMSHLPGFTILSPSDDGELERMLSYAVEECTGPVAIRYPRGEVQKSIWTEDGSNVTSACLRRSGRDVLLMTVGTTVYDALAAADLLNEKGIDVAVAEVRAVKPLDVSSLKTFCEGKKLLVSLEDNVVIGGLGQQMEDVPWVRKF